MRAVKYIKQKIINFVMSIVYLMAFIVNTKAILINYKAEEYILAQKSKQMYARVEKVGWGKYECVMEVSDHHNTIKDTLYTREYQFTLRSIGEPDWFFESMWQGLHNKGMEFFTYALRDSKRFTGSNAFYQVFYRRDAVQENTIADLMGKDKLRLYLLHKFHSQI